MRMLLDRISRVTRFAFCRLTSFLLAGAVALTPMPAAFAQTSYPTGPVRIIVGFQAGGITDSMARLLAQELTKTLGQPVLVENRAGASGIIGSDYVAKSSPDGSLITMAPSGLMVLYRNLGMKLPLDPAKDLMPITQFYDQDLLLIVRAESDIRTIQDLVAAAKAAPGKVSYGSTGIGGPLHLGAEAFAMEAGVRLNHIAYKGETPMLPDLIGGQLDVAIGSPLFAANHVRSGRVRVVASLGPKRNPMFPDVPTIQEVYPGVVANSWQGLFLPAGTPAAVRDKLNAAMVAAIHGPLRSRIVEAGLNPAGGTPQELATYIDREMERWATIIQKVGVKLE